MTFRDTPVPTETSTELATDMVNCPGCGGRNPPDASECDWCGRAFISRGRRLRITFWQLLSTLLIVAIIGAVGALVFLNAGRTLPAPRLAPPPTVAAVASAAPTPAVTPRVTVAPTGAAVTPAPTATAATAAADQTTPTSVPTDEVSPTPEAHTAHIANTGGQGVMVRAAPGAAAAALGALREGTPVNVTGGAQTQDARTWREIETADKRLKGWVLDDFLAQ
jgi:hypothetical protein